jgi:uncharacterized membrane protein YgcG
LVAAKTGVLTKHGRGATKAGSLKKALDQAFEALNTLRAMRLKGNLEYAVACVEAGILYLLQLEDEGDPVNAGVHRDEALIQLETAQTQFEAFIRNHQKAAEGGGGGGAGGGGGTDGGGGSGAGGVVFEVFVVTVVVVVGLPGSQCVSEDASSKK